MAQKKERSDEISFDSGNAVIYNQITNLQGNPKKVALFFCPDRGRLLFSWLLSRNILFRGSISVVFVAIKCRRKIISRKRPHNG